MNKEEILERAQCCDLIASDISVTECGSDIFDFAISVRRIVLAELKSYAVQSGAATDVLNFIDEQMMDEFWEGVAK